MIQVTIQMPLELTADMLRDVRRDETTSTTDKDEMDRRIGWLICAWDVIKEHRVSAPQHNEGG